MSALAQSRHGLVHCECPLSGVKRTWAGAVQMSAFDPKRHRLSSAVKRTSWQELNWSLHQSHFQFSNNATVPSPPSAQMLTIARLPLGIAASSLTAWLKIRAPVAAKG